MKRGDIVRAIPPVWGGAARPAIVTSAGKKVGLLFITGETSSFEPNSLRGLFVFSCTLEEDLRTRLERGVLNRGLLRKPGQCTTCNYYERSAMVELDELTPPHEGVWNDEFQAFLCPEGLRLENEFKYSGDTDD